MKNQHDDSRAERVVDSTSAANKPGAPPAEEAKKIETIGVVTDCEKLNVRAAADPNADVVAVIPSLTEVVIDADASTSGFYRVCTAAGVEGFCMRKYIAVRK